MRARSTAVACNPAAGTWASLSLRRRLWLGGLRLGFLLSWAVMVLGSGCSLLIKQGPADLRYAGISLVDFADAPGGLSGRPDRKVLVVTVATNRDLGADIFDTGAIVDIRARTCSPDSPSLKIGAIGPFYRDMDLGMLLPEERARYSSLIAEAPKGEPYPYRFWFDYRWNGERYLVNGVPDDSYDLLKNPQDVCASIEGNPYMGVGIGVSTNTVTIPKQAIVDALAKGLP